MSGTTLDVVVFKDLKTLKLVAQNDVDIWWLTEGNGSCDCNRELLFGNEDLEGICESKRYIVYRIIDSSVLEPQQLISIVIEANSEYKIPKGAYL